MQCTYCERYCHLEEGRHGFCRMYQNQDGRLVERFPDKWCAYAVSRVESIPFYHAYPGSRCMVVGTAGCNLDCRYCSNAYAAKEDPGTLTDILLDIAPEALVALARKQGCHSIVFAINEPTVSLPTLGRVSEAARAAGIPMGCLTNGYATPEATALLGTIFSFINVSLKGLSSRFCGDSLGIADSAPVVRNIRELAGRCHVEVTTPVIDGENDHELDQMAEIIAAIDPDIPWHVFRLLPTHKMSEREYPNIGDINNRLEKLRGRLPYLYFHNFIGSEWVGTRCPGCGTEVITRHSLGCGGDKLDAFRCQGDACPQCGGHIALLGTRVALERRGGARMSLAILDARQWQQVVDLHTGRKSDADGPLVATVKGLLARHPFPGDRDPRGNAWVTETALDLIDRYDPGFVFLTYARQYYSSRYSALTVSERLEMRDAAFAEVERFSRESGFFTVIVGTGDMTEARVPIDLTGLDGLAVASNWSARYAGLYGLSDRDRDVLAGHPGLERVASRREILDLFAGGPADGERLPEHMAVAREGHYFNTTSLRRLVMIPARNAVVPVSANLEGVASITDVKDRVLDLLTRGRVAIAYLEGLGCGDFTVPYTACQNGRDWYCYEPGDGHYLALTTGRHSVFEHNGGYRYYRDDNETKPYPFSGYFTTMPAGTIGGAYPGKSIAVGNRSMFMHMTTGCDVACECFARNLYNQGVMAVIHRQDK